MNPYKRRHFIDQLSVEINTIGQEFESFGGLFLNLVLGMPMNTQGINNKGFPVAGVVDGASPDGLVAAEYSALKTYFASPMTKATGDLRHVLSKSPHAQQIYLLSSEKKRPQIAQKFEGVVNNWPEMSGRTVHVMGAVEIATKIVDVGLASDEAVQRLGSYLPSLARQADEEAAQALVPLPDRRRIPRPDVDAKLDQLFAQRKCVVLGGLGGSGKSDTAAAFAHLKKAEYQNVMWFEGSTITRIEDLKAVTITKAGELRNVAGLLSSRPCLLIIDDAGEGLCPDELSALCGPGSHVLLTRRAVTSDTYELPLLGLSDAALLLNRDIEPCPEQVFSRIWRTVGGHPLSISLINAAVSEGASWEDIELDCKDLGRYESGGQILADRLLARLHRSLAHELSVFEWAGQPRCDKGFFFSMTTPSGVKRLKKFGLIAPDRPSVIRLHDIVFTSLAAQDWWTAEQRQLITDRLADYLADSAQRTDLAFWSAAVNLKPLIHRLVEKGESQPSFTYALLSVWTPAEVNPDLLSDPVAEAISIRNGQKPASTIATMALIETVEKLFLRDKIVGQLHAEERLSQRICVFDDLATASGLSRKQRSEIQHHKAKALSRLKRDAEALEIFEQVLVSDHPLPESEIQIMRLLRKGSEYDKEQAAVKAERILSAAGAGEPVSYSVFFAAVEHSAWISKGHLIFKHETLIEKKLIEAVSLEIPQALQTISSIARFLSRESPEFLNRLLAAIPPKTLEDISSPKERFDWGDILFEASRTAGKAALALQVESLRYFESLPNEPFHSQRHAELLLFMGRAVEAKGLLLRREDLNQNPFAQRLMALVENRLENPAQALVWIDQAFENLSERHAKFRIDFHEHRFDILWKLADANAIADLKNAIALCTEGKDHDRLELKYFEHQAGLQP